MATRALGVVSASSRSPRVSPTLVQMLPTHRAISLREFYPYGTHEGAQEDPSLRAGASGVTELLGGKSVMPVGSAPGGVMRLPGQPMHAGVSGRGLLAQRVDIHPPRLFFR